jgi:hypothetical protein
MSLMSLTCTRTRFRSKVRTQIAIFWRLLALPLQKRTLLDMVLGRTTYQIHVLDQLEKERNSKLPTCNLMFWCPLPLNPTPFVVMAIKFTTTATNVPKCRTGRGMTFEKKIVFIHHMGT